MPIHQNTSSLSAIYKGSSQLSKVYAGSTQIWPDAFTAYDLDFLVIGGGGRGGYAENNNQAGGGGAGGFVSSVDEGVETISAAGITITVSVGAGGVSVTDRNNPQNNGNASYFSFSGI